MKHSRPFDDSAAAATMKGVLVPKALVTEPAQGYQVKERSGPLAKPLLKSFCHRTLDIIRGASSCVMPLVTTNSVLRVVHMGTHVDGVLLYVIFFNGGQVAKSAWTTRVSQYR